MEREHGNCFSTDKTYKHAEGNTVSPLKTNTRAKTAMTLLIWTSMQGIYSQGKTSTLVGFPNLSLPLSLLSLFPLCLLCPSFSLVFPVSVCVFVNFSFSLLSLFVCVCLSLLVFVYLYDSPSHLPCLFVCLSLSLSFSPYL